MKIICLAENTEGLSGCGAEHGLCLYIETKKHRLLLDTGASDLFSINAEKLDIDLTAVDTVILSHGHYDHSGGILTFAKINPEAKIYLHHNAGGDFYHDERYIGIDKDILKLPQLVFTDDFLEIDDELTLFSGITGRRYFSKSNLALTEHTANGKIRDSFSHEQCLVISDGNRKILVSGCAHNGILNILDKYRELFGGNPQKVITGFHMMKKTDYTDEETEIIVSTARELMKTDINFYSGHCTGIPAFQIMKKIMGDKLTAIHSGDMVFEEE